MIIINAPASRVRQTGWLKQGSYKVVLLESLNFCPHRDLGSKKRAARPKAPYRVVLGLKSLLPPLSHAVYAYIYILFIYTDKVCIYIYTCTFVYIYTPYLYVLYIYRQIVTHTRRYRYRLYRYRYRYRYRK